MKNINILIIICLFFISSYSQKNTVVSGGIATGATGSSSYSIGQIDYTTQISTSGFVSQGVQQPFEVIVLDVTHEDKPLVNIFVYPNPTKDIATIDFKDYLEWENLKYILVDMNGKIIQKNKEITDYKTNIDISVLPIGIYFLNISTNEKQLKTFKIIKKE